MKQQKNNGFTLIEVLVAVIILAIVCIPVFRAITTSANTTGKAKMKMRATNIAENIMEDIKNLTPEETVEKYSLKAQTLDPTSDSVYVMNLDKDVEANDVDGLLKDIDIYESMAGDYNVTITLDPKVKDESGDPTKGVYSQANGYNISEFDGVSQDASAIYCLSDALDQKVALEYAEMNRLYYEKNKDIDSSLIFYDPNDSSKVAALKEKLKRAIVIDIKKSGDTISVDAIVQYYLPDDKIVEENQKTYRAFGGQIFNNEASGNDLSSVFVMYPPRYSASKDYGDILVVNNPYDIETNLYVVAQKPSSSEDEWKDYTSCNASKGGLVLQIYETIDKSSEEPGAITLRTNLITDEKNVKNKNEVPKPGETTPKDATVGALLTVGGKTPKDITGTFDDTLFKNIKKNVDSSLSDSDKLKRSRQLDAQTLDGRLYDDKKITNRIYSVKVYVNKTVATDEWPIEVTLEGTTLCSNLYDENTDAEDESEDTTE